MIRVRLLATSRPPMTSPAEALIDTGRTAHLLLRRVASMQEVCALLGCKPEHVALALDFFAANDGLKLRALVEDWPVSRIVQELATRQPEQATEVDQTPGVSPRFPAVAGGLAPTGWENKEHT